MISRNEPRTLKKKNETLLLVESPYESNLAKIKAFFNAFGLARGPFFSL